MAALKIEKSWTYPQYIEYVNGLSENDRQIANQWLQDKVLSPKMRTVLKGVVSRPGYGDRYTYSVQTVYALAKRGLIGYRGFDGGGCPLEMYPRPKGMLALALIETS